MRKVTADMRAHGLRMKAQAWTKALAAARVASVRDEALRSGLRSDLRALRRAALAVEQTM